jgi:SAM-dependent methyltransferase
MTPQNDRDSLNMFAASDAYDRFMGRWSRRLAPVFANFAELKGRGRVVDVGCGIGALSFAVLEGAPSVTAIAVDRSLAYAHFAQHQSPSQRVRFLVGNAQALPIATNSMDAALALLVINFIPDPTEAVQQMIRVIRPGGIVAAAVWDYGASMEMLRVFWDEVVALDPAASASDERHMPLCRRGELAALWRGNGLEHVQERELAVELAFSSFDDYWQPFLGGQGPAGAYAASLSNGQRASLEARLRTRLVGRGNDGPFTLAARAWAAKGVVSA